MEIKFTREEIIDAIKKIDIDPKLRLGRHSSTYDLVYDNKNYPPILVLSVANELKNSKELTLSDFGNNIDIPFKILRGNGFEVRSKVVENDNSLQFNYSKQLISFLEQAKTGNLKTKHFQREYKDTKVKVSFGQGGSAKTPWISFLKEPFTTSDGIYPVYLFYKDVNRLVLAYGKSETNKPTISWNISSAQSISQYFKENSFEKPNRYGDSLVFKVYDVNNLPNEDVLNEDLDEIIKTYFKVINNDSSHHIPCCKCTYYQLNSSNLF